MDSKVQIGVISVAGTPNNNRIFAIIMGEKDGGRYFPIIVNEAEAQSVVVQIQKISVPRPTVHDAFADFIKQSGRALEEVFIYNVLNGVFYAHLIFNDGLVTEAKAADAVALSLRFSCPIYTLESIIESENIVPDIELAIKRSSAKEIETLNKKLEEAIKAEDYERAAKLRDAIKEIKGRNENNNG